MESAENLVLADKRRENCLSRAQLIFLLLVMTLGSTVPIMNNFLTDAHDLMFHLSRIEGIYRGLKAGDFPVYINSTQLNGFGYASGVMYPQLFLYIPAILRFFHVSLIDSYKFLILLINFGTVISSWFSFHRILRSDTKGLIASGLYVFCMYRLTNIYTRAALGESLAMVFLPLMIYGLYECIWGDRKKWPWLAVSFTCVIYSHMLYAEICLVFCIIISLCGLRSLWKQKKRILALGKAAVFTLLMSIGFLVPFFSWFDQDFNVFSQISWLNDTGVYFSQMFEQFTARSFGYNVGAGTTSGEMPLSIGILIPIGLLALCWFALEQCSRKDSRQKKGHDIYKTIIVISVMMGLLALFLSSSNKFWNYVLFEMPLHETLSRFLFPIQYAWRFLGFASLFLVMPAASGYSIFFENIGINKNSVSVFLMVMLTIILSFPYFDQLIQADSVNEEVIGLQVSAIGFTDDLYLYEGDNLYILESMDFEITCDDDYDIEFTNLEKKASKLDFDVLTNEDADADNDYVNNGYISVTVPVYYYPGYSANINGIEIETERGDNGLITLNLPRQDGHVKIMFKAATEWEIAKVCSLICGIVFIVYLVKRRDWIVEFKI